MGGLSAEREISLLTGQAMVAALKEQHLNVIGLDLKNKSDLLKIVKLKPDVVVNGLHGTGGEDGALQGFLQWMDIPYTGSRLLASALAMNKHQAKLIMKAKGLPTAPWCCLTEPPYKMPKDFKFPVVIKPNQQGSAIGIAIAHHQKEFDQAIKQAQLYSQELLIERYLPGKEVSVGVVAGKALPIIEIIPKNKFYDYEAKYVAGMSEHIIPARLTASQTKRVQQLAEQTAMALDCTGTPRIDMIIGEKGEINILEVNTLPGMTATSLLPEAARHAGISFIGIILYNIMEGLKKRS